MAVLGELQANYIINNLFDVYVGKNHHYTKMGINAEILGEPPLDNDEIFYTLLGGNHMNSEYPAWYEYLGQWTCTGGSSTTITANGLTPGALNGKIIEIVSGFGLGQRKKILSNTDTTITLETFWSFGFVPANGLSDFRVVGGAAMYHLRADFANRPINFYLPHNNYTFWVMAYDQNGTPKVARFHINTDALLANMSPLYNTESPVIIGHTTTNTTNSTITVQAKQGETVRVYWEHQMDDAIGNYWPDSHDGFVVLGDQLHEKRRGTPYNDTPLASGIVSNANGQITLTIPDSQFPQYSGGPLNDIRVVASAQAPGKGQSFMTAPCYLKHPATGINSIPDTKQSRIFLTATNSTRTAGVRVQGTTERLHNAVAKQYDSLTGAETTPDQQYYRYNFTNDDNPANYHLISGGIWLPIGLTTNLVFKHEQAGLQTTWWGNSFAVTGVSTTTRTAFISREDAWTRGRDPALVKDTLTWFSATWGVGDKVYLNDNPTDLSTAGDGHYWINAQGVAITIAGGQGVISHRQVPVY